MARSRPHLAVAALCLVAFAASWFAAFLLRFEFVVPSPYREVMLTTLPFALLIKFFVFATTGVFDILWAYVGLRDLLRIFRATVFASGALAAADALLVDWISLPRSILLMDGLLTFLFVGGVFATLRYVRESRSRGPGPPLPMDPVFIVGAGDAGDSLHREFQRGGAGVHVVGFLDDNPGKYQRRLRGVRVLGPVDAAERLARQHGVRKAFVAIPSADGPTLRRIVHLLIDAGLSVRVLPPFGQISTSGSLIPQLREVAIEDLLRREPVKLDAAGISAFIQGRTVLVTGAAGSIGSELCRQILEFKPARLVALDNAETPLHSLSCELAPRAPGVFIAELADVTDPDRIRALFASHRPQAVFHAAAYKHVPMLEAHPREAARVNLTGTRIVSDASSDCGAEAFVLISTDKAVNPESVMGTTKRIAERMVLCASDRKNGRRIAVRFGNVLGSNGSVLPMFRAQLARGGPLTVTHPDMMRYFMTIPEAVQLVLQAAQIGQGGETFLLDMGKPVKILDLAEDLIRLSGLVPGVDVKIEYTGIRPGEKLFEELHYDSESVRTTAHPKIWFVKPESDKEPDGAILDRLERCARETGSADEICALLGQLVPEFRSRQAHSPAPAGTPAGVA